MIRAFRLAALLPAVALAAAALGARADGLTVVDGNGVTQTTCAISVLGTLFPCHIAYGSDGTNYHPLLTDGAGRLVIEVDGADSSLPLPANAAQESGGHLASIDTATASAASSASTTTAELGATTSPAAGSVNGQLASLAAATATAANQTAVQASAGSSASKAVGIQGVTGGVAVKTDGSGVTQPVSGQVTASPLGATSNNGSSAIASGGAFQTLLAANPSRKGCLVQNPPTATEPLYVSVGVATASATVAKSYTLLPGNRFSCIAGPIVITDNIAVEAATTGHAFVEIDQ